MRISYNFVFFPCRALRLCLRCIYWNVITHYTPTKPTADEDETEYFPYPTVDVNANSELSSASYARAATDYQQQQQYQQHQPQNWPPPTAHLEHIDCRLNDTGVTIEDDIFNTNYAMAPSAAPGGNIERHLSAAQLDSTRPLRQLYDFHFAVDDDTLDVAGPGGGGTSAFTTTTTTDAFNHNDNRQGGGNNTTFADTCHANNNYHVSRRRVCALWPSHLCGCNASDRDERARVSRVIQW